MYCDHCGSTIHAGLKFCSVCGGKIQVSGTSQPTPRRDFARDRRRGSSQTLQKILLVSIPALFVIIIAFGSSWTHQNKDGTVHEDEHFVIKEGGVWKIGPGR